MLWRSFSKHHPLPMSIHLSSHLILMIMYLPSLDPIILPILIGTRGTITFLVYFRFANGLVVNDPLQTLYQSMSGRQPIAVNECADANWGDWRPHLAMILSNPSSKEGLDQRWVNWKEQRKSKSSVSGFKQIFKLLIIYLLWRTGQSWHLGTRWQSGATSMPGNFATWWLIWSSDRTPIGIKQTRSNASGYECIRILW